MSPRDPQTRKRDALARLTSPAVDTWVASASPAGAAHLVPLSLCWTSDRAVVAVDSTSVTARNVVATGRARLGVGPTRDVVMIDAELDRVVPADETADDGGALGTAYATQADWDPRGSTGYAFLVLRPVRVQAWREVDEMAGRTLMTDGRWLV
ncbi:pyridoxamine 5'-phosphate oxidase family protein [Nocardioides abyssi]|uniref:Pyridoxamine 5'-phosphate oxidase family protein n=1 Tax=Nocardioides abyssi TaxID=3058370 RepID=A0ABT8ESI7_9ACTN|nr:pyridoxamine 5'-phosphate oxidase family protein [Nocardioides abyssi]MDN4161072.1 pyridoxamine 5'-phosphate oxidase family protein [Nocardioides abyssi]